MKELNEKIARWVGFTKSADCWVRPDGKLHGINLPDFTESLDACFKWVVPKLNKLKVTCGLVAYCENDAEAIKAYYAWLASVAGPYDAWFADAETPALAFCLAVEKLIDSEGG